MKRRLHAGLCMTAIGGLLVASLGATAAVAAEKPGDDVLSALAATAQTDEAPDVLSSTADPASVGVTVPGNSSGPIVIASGNAAIEVTLPGAAADAVTIGDGLVGFDGGDGSTSVPVAKMDGSVQLISVIDGPSSPTEYRYEFDLPAGATLNRVEDGGVAVKAADGSVLFGVLAPWAVDANGDAVATSYAIAGNALVQHVAHGSSNAYPVVADPWLGGTWVESWSWYSGATRIAMTPTLFAKAACPGNVVCAATWQGVAQSELANAQVTSGNKTKINRATTGNQIGCHMVGGAFKSPWNLETDAADKGLLGFIASACN